MFTGGAVLWRKSIWEAEAHDTAKIHGEVYTRYSVAIAIFFPLSFISASDFQEKQFVAI